jgi:Flp pilus assembly protein TadB
VIRAGALAALLGVGLWLIARGLVPVARPLKALSDELVQPRAGWAVRPGHDPVRTWWHRLATRLAGQPSARLQADLAVLGRTPARHTLDRLGYATIFLALAVAPVVVLPMAGVPLPPVATPLAVLAFSGAGWWWPDVEVRSHAAAARRRWAQTLTVYVDIVSISLAGGAGVEDALTVAARAGSGAEFATLADALRTAHTRRQRLWDAMDELGSRADIGPLRELAAAVELAAESGSRIRETLIAKAAAMRVRQLTEIEADAQKASETMGIAPALMAVAAVVLIGYPAVARFFEG